MTAKFASPEKWAAYLVAATQTQWRGRRYPAISTSERRTMNTPDENLQAIGDLARFEMMRIKATTIGTIVALGLVYWFLHA